MNVDYNTETQEITVELNTQTIELDTPTGGRGLKGDTGPQGPQGIQGEQGIQGVSGVWVGSVEPSTGYDVWINPEETESTVNNATLTVQKNGSSIGTFTANSSTNTTINITTPTKTSDLTNDSGYINNLSNYYTKTEVDNAISTAINNITDGDEVNY